MRKALVLMTGLFLLSFAGLGAVHTAIAATQDQITLTEHCHVGNLSAAEGLTSDLRIQISDQLCWDTHLTVGKPPETDFRFHPAPEPFSSQERCGVTLDADTVVSLYIDTADAARDHRLGWLQQPLADLAVPSASQEAVQKTISVADYLTDYQLHISVLRPEGPIDAIAANHDFLQDLQNAFRFPVLESHQVALCLEPLAGSLYFTAEDVETTAPTIQSWTDDAATFLYFIPEARTHDGRLLDYSRTPAGYGVYRLPDSGPPSVEPLEMVFPLRDSQHIRGLQTLPDGETLSLLIQEGTQMTLWLLDGTTGLPTQQFPLRSPASFRHCKLLCHEDLLLIGMDDSFSFLCRDSSGQWLLQLEGQFPSVQPSYIQPYDDLAWDGARLAIACCYNSSFSPDFSLMVYDTTGLLYHGDFQTSLGTESRGSLMAPHPSAIRCQWSETRQPL